MKDVLFRFTFVWFILHIILFFVEMYRYKNSNWSCYAFRHYGMLDITYGVLFIDTVGISIVVTMGFGYWILQPIIT